MLGLLGNILPVALIKVEPALHDNLKEDGIALIVKGWVTTKQDEQNHTKGPHVHLLAITTLHQNLRGNVVWCTACCLERNVVIEKLGKTKVCDKNVGAWRAVTEQQVLRLEITMNNALCMEILDGLSHLTCDAGCICLSKVAFFHDAVKQLATRHVVKHKVQLLFSVVALMHAHNVWVLDLLQDGNLSLNHIFLASAQCLVDDLACILFLAGTVLGQTHNCKVAGAKLGAKLVFTLHVTLGVAGSDLLHTTKHLAHYRSGSGLFLCVRCCTLHGFFNASHSDTTQVRCRLLLHSDQSTRLWLECGQFRAGMHSRDANLITGGCGE
eukprot:m.150017 g.150017  ORF g.150017 m.150017 type:complete len:325 (-) comp14217_c0_seq3:14-988(-)